MNIRLASDYFRARAEKYEVLGQLPQSKKTFMISGYVPEKAVPALEKALNEKYTLSMDVEELAEDEEGPVLLSNNGFSESVEGVLSPMDCQRKARLTQQQSCPSSTCFYLD